MCAKFQRNTWSITYFLTNGIFRHWSTNLTIDDVITQERATVFSSNLVNFIVLSSTITAQNFKTIGLPEHGHSASGPKSPPPVADKN